jgi:hypothetical protein
LVIKGYFETNANYLTPEKLMGGSDRSKTSGVRKQIRTYVKN